MTVRVNKSSFNIREKLSELGRKFGLKGSELVAAETVQEARDLVSAGRKNMIINGSMQVAQRATSVATGVVPNANSQYYTCDRFSIFGIGNDTAEWTNSQSTDAPEGFGSSWKWDCTTAHASPDSSVRQQIGQIIEAQNLQHLNYGTSKAKEMTLSFWVKATKIGLNYVFLYHYDNNDFLAHKYYINQSNTWEKKTITITGAGAAAIANDNGHGVAINWMLYLGSNYTNGTYQENTWLNWQDTNYNMFEDQTNHADSTSNDFYITGVQLEVGKNATDFEYRSIGEELALCQRYYQRINSTASNSRMAISGNGSPALSYPTTFLRTTMRIAPTIDYSAVGDFWNEGLQTGKDTVTAISLNIATTDTVTMSVTASGGNGTAQGTNLLGKNSNAYLSFDAEL